jgi:predicted MFS family arabinose efflux permease
MALDSLAPLLGPPLGPLLGGVMNYYVNWRCTYYIVIIWPTIFLVLIILFAPET